MTEELKVFINQLCTGNRETIDLTLSSSFLDLSQDQEVVAFTPVSLKGEAYCLDEFLMLSLKVETTIEMPCSICNAMTEVRLQNKNILLSFPLAQLPSLVFDYTESLREEVIMLIPQFIECENGVCPKRKELQSYLKTENLHYFPFADLQ